MIHPTPKTFRAWVLDKLDNDSVRQWIPPYCAVWLTWGLFAAFILPPVSIIERSMGHQGYQAWVWTSICGNLIVILGMWMRHGGSSVVAMSKPLLLRDWMGLFLQGAGHTVCSIMLFMFEVGAVIGAIDRDAGTPYAGMTIFAAVMLLPWTFGTAFLSAQCGRKVQRGMQLERFG